MQSPNGFLEYGDGRQVEVVDGLTIGRIDACGLVLEDHKVSRRHARLTVDHGVVEIIDLGSSNGIRLNGQTVKQRMLRADDELLIGTTKLIYRRVDMPKAVEPSVSSQRSTTEPAESDVEIIEFVDEVVKVRARKLTVQLVSSSPRKSKRIAAADHGVLQYSKRVAKRGWLGDEVGQLGGLPKFLLVVVVLAMSAGLAWLTMYLVTT